MHYVAVPKQRGSTDCGLFAMAYAQLLLDQKEPSHYVFDQSKMREQYNYFVANNYLDFAATQIPNSTSERKTVKLTIKLC